MEDKIKIQFEKFHILKLISRNKEPEWKVKIRVEEKCVWHDCLLADEYWPQNPQQA